MKEIERRIYVSDEIAMDEYSYVYGDKKDETVTFRYYNFKKDREGSEIYMTYSNALSLARERSCDGRYKNYEFLIG